MLTIGNSRPEENNRRREEKHGGADECEGDGDGEKRGSALKEGGWEKKRRGRVEKR